MSPALWAIALPLMVNSYAVPLTSGPYTVPLTSRRRTLPQLQRSSRKDVAMASVLPPGGSGSDEVLADAAEPVVPSLPIGLVCATAALQSACFGTIGTALPPALRASGLAPAAVAMTLGRIGSASALAEVLLSGSFGNLADAAGRKPLLLVAPAVTVAARCCVVLRPDVNVLLAARLVSAFAVPVYWLAFQASLADVYGADATKLAVLGSRVQAAMGLGYAVASVCGGYLANVDVRLAYAASSFLGCCVMACVSRLPETLPAKKRVDRGWRAGFQPFVFLNLFRRGLVFAELNAVVLLQSLTNGMGDLWQVLARELRDWGSDMCGRYAALVGVASMAGTLLTGPSIKALGPRGHTCAATSASVVSSLMLGQATTNAVAYGALAPIALGAGRSHATGARIVNLGTELGVPQGQLSAERTALNAVVKVVAPTLYATLFAFGAKRGVIALPFYATASLLALSVVLAATIRYDAEGGA